MLTYSERSKDPCSCDVRLTENRRGFGMAAKCTNTRRRGVDHVGADFLATAAALAWLGLRKEAPNLISQFVCVMCVCLYVSSVFSEAASFGGSNIDPTVWEDKKCQGESRFPAQVRIHVRKLCKPLEEDAFRPVLHHYDGPKFRLELSIPETLDLLELCEQAGV
ncbi:hypothetical protein BUALT_Bualt13G0082700 [Buddleja alternifolia]|uniref:DCD domain-containing protein n=1 Tax=Buddleja alternifolia TaxID=168488 RepID=A0AAV6WU71_9LAMI|nr:hypothetical protein BUALT_Bualt13G0082700 [Buddleja alternifolia]